MLLGEVVTAFLDSLKDRPNTYRNYAFIVKEYLRFLDAKFGASDINNISKAGTLDAFGYFEYIREKPGVPARYHPEDSRAANSTVYLKIKCLRRFYNVLHAEGVVSRNIFNTQLIRLPNPRERMKRPTERVPLSVIKRLIRGSEGTLRGSQLRCLISMMLAGGLRLSEALSLSVNDVKIDRSPGDLPQGTLFLELRVTKAGRPQRQALAAWCSRYVQKQVSQRLREGALPGDRLFVSYSRAGVVTRAEYLDRSARRHISRALSVAGGPECSTHSFRKTFINRLLEVEKDVNKVRQAARHSSVVSTQIYLDDISEISDSIAKSANYF